MTLSSAILTVKVPNFHHCRHVHPHTKGGEGVVTEASKRASTNLLNE